MFSVRLFSSVLRSSIKPVINLTCSKVARNTPTGNLLSFAPVNYRSHSTIFLQSACLQPQSTLLSNPTLIQKSNENNSRTVTKYSIRKGKRKSVKTVLKRFYRLHWGGWIRTIAGRHRKIWRKSPRRKLRMKHHVLCNATQCTLLDKMVTNYWRKPKYYVDDPYEPYHSREEYMFTYKKPKPYHE